MKHFEITCDCGNKPTGFKLVKSIPNEKDAQDLNDWLNGTSAKYYLVPTIGPSTLWISCNNCLLCGAELTESMTAVPLE